MAGDSVTTILQGGPESTRIPAERQPVARLRKAIGRLYAIAERHHDPLSGGLAADLLALSGGFAPMAGAETLADRVLADMAQDLQRRRVSPALPLLLRGDRAGRGLIDALTDLKADAGRPKPPVRP